MTPIPFPMRRQMAKMPLYSVCARLDDDCHGRITWEHVFVFAGRRLNEIWAIIPLCEYHHSVGRHQDGPGLNKEINRWIALSRATEADLDKYKTANLRQMREFLNKKFAGIRVDNTVNMLRIVGDISALEWSGIRLSTGTA